MDNYNNLRRIALKYNFNNITHFVMINKLLDDKFIEITNNEFIKLNTNYIIDHYTNITKTKHIIFILSQDMNDYILCYYNNHNEIIIDDILLENESFLTNVIDILRLNNFKKILYIYGHDYYLLYKNILCYKSSIYYKNNFRYINELDNERSQYNINKLDNLKIKDIKLDKILDMINKIDIDIYSDCNISIITDDISNYYNTNLDKNICELFKYIRSNYDEIYHNIYDKIYDIIDLYKFKTKHMYLDLY